MTQSDNVNAESHLLAGYILDGKGGAKKCDWGKIKSWSSDQGKLWVHLDRTDPVSQEWLRNESGVPRLIVDQLLEDETRPIALTKSKGVFINLRGVNLNPDKRPEDMVAIRMWVEEDRIVTTRKFPVMAVRDLDESIRQNNAPETTCDFIYRVANRLIDRMAGTIVDLQEALDDIDASIPDDMDTTTVDRLREKRRLAIRLRRFLMPQMDALDTLVNNAPTWFAEGSLQNIRTAEERTKRFVEMLDGARDQAKYCQEELFVHAAEKNAQTTTVLTVIAAIFLPLSFLTGLLGINVGGMPGANDDTAFWIVVGLCAVVVVLEFILFRKKGWI